MPIVLQTVVVIDLTDAPPDLDAGARCDGCTRPVGPAAGVALVRNRFGPAAVRQVHLCPSCQATLRAISEGPQA